MMRRSSVADTASLFVDSPMPPRGSIYRARYAGPCKPLRTAAHFADALVAAVDPARKAMCYRNMIAALIAKDGVR